MLFYFHAQFRTFTLSRASKSLDGFPAKIFAFSFDRYHFLVTNNHLNGKYVSVEMGALNVTWQYNENSIKEDF